MSPPLRRRSRHIQCPSNSNCPNNVAQLWQATFRKCFFGLVPDLSRTSPETPRIYLPSSYPIHQGCTVNEQPWRLSRALILPICLPLTTILQPPARFPRKRIRDDRSRIDLCAFL